MPAWCARLNPQGSRQVKRPYIGWLVVLGLACAGLLAVALTPVWRHANPIEEQLALLERAQAVTGPPPEPAQGKVSHNLPRALRLQVPVVAYFCEEWQRRVEHAQHTQDPALAAAHATMLKAQAEQDAQRSMLTTLAADYRGVLAVVAITPEWGPATFRRSRVGQGRMPATIIYSPADREVWRHQGRVTREQLVKELAKLNLGPRAAARSTAG